MGPMSFLEAFEALRRSDQEVEAGDRQEMTVIPEHVLGPETGHVEALVAADNTTW